MKILSTNNFTIKLLCKLLSDLSIQKVVFDNKKFGSKVINNQYFHMKNSLSMKKLSIKGCRSDFFILCFLSYNKLLHTPKAVIFQNLSCIARLVLVLEAKVHFRLSH